VTPATVDHKDQLLALIGQLSPEQTATLMKTLLHPGAGSTASVASTSTTNVQELNQVPTLAAAIQKPNPPKPNQDAKTDSQATFVSPLFGNKKCKAFDISAEDDDDKDDVNLGQLKHLPLTKTGNPAARIIRIVTNTNGGINGFVIYLEGYADRWISEILSKRNENNVYKRLLDHIGPPAGRICTVLLPNPNPQANPKGCERKNVKNYLVKVMAFVYPGTTQPTDKVSRAGTRSSSIQPSTRFWKMNSVKTNDLICQREKPKL
jgi:hypothetical protein